MPHSRLQADDRLLLAITDTHFSTSGFSTSGFSWNTVTHEFNSRTASRKRSSNSLQKRCRRLQDRQPIRMYGQPMTHPVTRPTPAPPGTAIPGTAAPTTSSTGRVIKRVDPTVAAHSWSSADAALRASPTSACAPAVAAAEQPTAPHGSWRRTPDHSRQGHRMPWDAHQDRTLWQLARDAKFITPSGTVSSASSATTWDDIAKDFSRRTGVRRTGRNLSSHMTKLRQKLDTTFIRGTWVGASPAAHVIETGGRSTAVPEGSLPQIDSDSYLERPDDISDIAPLVLGTPEKPPHCSATDDGHVVSSAEGKATLPPASWDEVQDQMLVAMVVSLREAPPANIGNFWEEVALQFGSSCGVSRSCGSVKRRYSKLKEVNKLRRRNGRKPKAIVTRQPQPQPQPQPHQHQHQHQHHGAMSSSTSSVLASSQDVSSASSTDDEHGQLSRPGLAAWIGSQKLLIGTDGQIRTCSKALATMMTAHRQLQHSWPFLEPVNIEKLDIPDYLPLLQRAGLRPMDFGTIRRGLHAGVYKSAADFCCDVDMVFRCCREFNPPAHPISSFCDKTERAFYSLLKPLLSTNAPQRSQVKPHPQPQPQPQPPGGNRFSASPVVSTRQEPPCCKLEYRSIPEVTREMFPLQTSTKTLSGYVGVYWVPGRAVWYPECYPGRINIGNFKDKETAALAAAVHKRDRNVTSIARFLEKIEMADTAAPAAPAAPVALASAPIMAPALSCQRCLKVFSDRSGLQCHTVNVVCEKNMKTHDADNTSLGSSIKLTSSEMLGIAWLADNASAWSSQQITSYYQAYLVHRPDTLPSEQTFDAVCLMSKAVDGKSASDCNAYFNSCPAPMHQWLRAFTRNAVGNSTDKPTELTAEPTRPPPPTPVLIPASIPAPTPVLSPAVALTLTQALALSPAQAQALCRSIPAQWYHSGSHLVPTVTNASSRLGRHENPGQISPRQQVQGGSGQKDRAKPSPDSNPLATAAVVGSTASGSSAAKSTAPPLPSASLPAKLLLGPKRSKSPSSRGRYKCGTCGFMPKKGHHNCGKVIAASKAAVSMTMKGRYNSLSASTTLTCGKVVATSKAGNQVVFSTNLRDATRTAASSLQVAGSVQLGGVGSTSSRRSNNHAKLAVPRLASPVPGVPSRTAAGPAALQASCVATSEPSVSATERPWQSDERLALKGITEANPGMPWVDIAELMFSCTGVWRDHDSVKTNWTMWKDQGPSWLHHCSLLLASTEVPHDGTAVHAGRPGEVHHDLLPVVGGLDGRLDQVLRDNAPYNCPHCNRAFQLKCSIISHVKTHFVPSIRNGLRTASQPATGPIKSAPSGDQHGSATAIAVLVVPEDDPGKNEGPTNAVDELEEVVTITESVVAAVVADVYP